MKSNPLNNILAAAICALILLIMPAITLAQTEPSSAGPPPIEQQLVREGDLAVKLVSALGVEDVTEEAEAESDLAAIGIAPKNGWIADYPVTPDIADELRQSVIAAADAGKLSIDTDIVLKEFDKVLAGLGLAVAPYGDKTAQDSVPPQTASYVDPDVVNNYYYSQGPPIVTYYPPPPTYTYLYSWVPYPFYTTGYLFPGFFVLHDFHRIVVRHRRSFFITNHFRDFRSHRIFRVDPRARFKGHSSVFRRGHHFKSLGSGKVGRNDGNFSSGRHRTRSLDQVRAFSPRSQTGRVFSRPVRKINVDTRRQVARPRSFAPSSQNVRSFNRSSNGSGRDTGRSFNRTRIAPSSSRDMRSFNRHSGGSGRDSLHFKRGGSSGRQSSGGRSFSRSSSRGGRFSHGGGRGSHGGGRGRR